MICEKYTFSRQHQWHFVNTTTNVNMSIHKNVLGDMVAFLKLKYQYICCNCHLISFEWLHQVNCEAKFNVFHFLKNVNKCKVIIQHQDRRSGSAMIIMFIVWSLILFSFFDLLLQVFLLCGKNYCFIVFLFMTLALF